MPIYEYRCESCEHIFEVLTTSGSSLETVQCAKCGSDKVSKILSAGSFRRGSGPSLANAAAPPSGCGKKSGFS
jgi:putative FmdB family regulatory protein